MHNDRQQHKMKRITLLAHSYYVILFLIVIVQRGDMMQYIQQCILLSLLCTALQGSQQSTSNILQPPQKITVEQPQYTTYFPRNTVHNLIQKTVLCFPTIITEIITNYYDYDSQGTLLALYPISASLDPRKKIFTFIGYNHETNKLPWVETGNFIQSGYPVLLFVAPWNIDTLHTTLTDTLSEKEQKTRFQKTYSLSAETIYRPQVLYARLKIGDQYHQAEINKETLAFFATISQWKISAKHRDDPAVAAGQQQSIYARAPLFTASNLAQSWCQLCSILQQIAIPDTYHDIRDKVNTIIKNFPYHETVLHQIMHNTSLEFVFHKTNHRIISCDHRETSKYKSPPL